MYFHLNVMHVNAFTKYANKYENTPESTHLSVFTHEASIYANLEEHSGKRLHKPGRCDVMSKHSIIHDQEIP